MEIDIEALRLPDEVVTSSRSRLSARLSRARSAFVPGPIPLNWIDAAEAARVSEGISLRIWRLVRMQRRRRPAAVPVNVSRLARELGRSRRRVGLAISRLQKAGLIRVTRDAGRQLLIEILIPDETI
jgi:hypothetical protein